MKPRRIVAAPAWAMVLVSTGVLCAVAHASDASFSRSDTFDERSGEAIYRSICQGCHMPDGRGARGAGAYPALASNPRAASADYLAVVVLEGRRNMPAFARTLDDAQVAEVVTFVRTHLGNHYDAAFTAEQVARLRSPSSK